MATLIERLDKQIADLEAERARITKTVNDELAAVETKLAALVGARKVLTPETQAIYDGLVKLGLITDIS